MREILSFTTHIYRSGSAMRMMPKVSLLVLLRSLRRERPSKRRESRFISTQRRCVRIMSWTKSLSYYKIKRAAPNGSHIYASTPRLKIKSRSRFKRLEATARSCRWMREQGTLRPSKGMAVERSSWLKHPWYQKRSHSSRSRPSRKTLIVSYLNIRASSSSQSASASR